MRKMALAATVLALAAGGSIAPQGHGNNPGNVALGSLVMLNTLAPYYYDIYVDMAQSPLLACAETALSVCGEGAVCSLCVYDNSCSFTCQDSEGACAPAPPCGPTDEEPDYTGQG